MRYALTVIIFLSSCATREQIAIRNADMDISNYGPRCEKLGTKPYTNEWAICVSNYAKAGR